MKKIIYSVLILTFLFSNLWSQDFFNNFLGNDYKLYKGSLLIIDTSNFMGWDHKFYSNLNDCKKLYCENVVYPNKDYSWQTDKNKLKNKIFNVEDIIIVEDFSNNIVFKLKDTATKKIIYFKYDKSKSYYFPFLTNYMETDEQLCTKIEKKVDDFTNQITWYSPHIYASNILPVDFTKISTSSTTLIYLMLCSYGSSVSVGKKGVIVLFTDETKWESNSDVKCEVNEYRDLSRIGRNGDFEYSTAIRLNENDIELFRTKLIKKFRLYAYDNEIDEMTAIKLQKFLNCMISN
jgi:hypothetical protein